MYKKMPEGRSKAFVMTITTWPYANSRPSMVSPCHAFYCYHDNLLQIQPLHNLLLACILSRNHIQKRLQVKPGIIRIPYDYLQIVSHSDHKVQNISEVLGEDPISWRPIARLVGQLRELSKTYYLHLLSSQSAAGSFSSTPLWPSRSSFAYVHILD